MWTISRKIPSASIENNVHLLVGKEYIVGRKDCPVLIKDDPSISRKHAALVVSYDIANLGDISKVPELMLTDSSKYGSSVNGMKITQPTKLQDGDEVLFGTHGSVYRVTYTPLIAVTSCLESNKKKLLKKQIHKLGGHLINEWKTGHVNHLVMDGLVFTIKVIHALADCCHIVSPSWFDETVKAIEAQKTPPMPKMFLPPLKEETIKSDEPLFLPDQNRKTLFAGKTFYFLSSKQFKRTHEAIEMCSGKTILLELSKGLEYDKLVNDGSCLMMLDQKERENLPADNKECVTEIMDFLKSNKKRPIPESELGLAILEMNLAHYCNSNIDAVPAITQNIVCQSLNVGLDEMSQVYSPQGKKQSAQFKKPSSLNGQTDSKPVFQSGRKDSVKTAQSTITSTLTPARSTEQQKDNKRKVSVTETPESAMKSDKPKEIQKVSPIPETMNISDDGNVFVSETPSRKSSKSDITSFFVRNKNRKEVRSDSLSFDHSNVSEKEMTAKQTGKINLQNNKKDKAIVPDSLGFEESEIESAKKNQGVAKIGSLQKDAKQSTVVSDSLRPSTSDPESPPKEAFNFLASKRDKSFKRMIPDSLGLDSETNDFNTEQTSTRKESKSELEVAIPDSMGIDESYEEGTRSEMFITASSETTGTPMKRRRMTEDEKDLEKLPVKRMKNTTGELDKNDWYTNQGGKEENFIPSSDINEPGISTRTDVSSEHEIRTAQPDGFLSARVSLKPNLPAVRKPVISSDVSEEDFNEDDLPRNLIVVDVVSLVVRKPGGKKTAPVTEVRGKNFKKFKKQWYAGCDRRFPKIIGGNDLVVHQALSNLEHEDWFIEAREASQEQERRDRMEAELFMSDAGLPQRRRKAR